jgi:hypothetical protein
VKEVKEVREVKEESEVKEGSEVKDEVCGIKEFLPLQGGG